MPKPLLFWQRTDQKHHFPLTTSRPKLPKRILRNFLPKGLPLTSRNSGSFLMPPNIAQWTPNCDSNNLIGILWTQMNFAAVVWESRMTLGRYPHDYISGVARRKKKIQFFLASVPAVKKGRHNYLDDGKLLRKRCCFTSFQLWDTTTRFWGRIGDTNMLAEISANFAKVGWNFSQSTIGVLIYMVHYAQISN